MPLYEYKCPKHGKFEVFQFALAGEDSVRCPICKEESPLVGFSVPAKRNPRYGIG